MALVLKRMYQNYVYLSHERLDPVFKEGLTVSPIYFASLLTAYILLVKKFGPQFMKNRQPYNIQNIIIVYNVLQILANTYIFFKALYIYQRTPYWICIDSQDQDLIISGRYEWYLLKMLDCVETTFFVLKKSYRQISFLHVYHHAGMFLGSWITMRFNMGDSCVFTPAVNGFVHVVMFSYYLLTSIDAEWKKSLNIKKSLTQIQIVQFIVFIVFYGSSVVIPNCKGALPLFITIVWIVQNFFMCMLFSDFYLKTYWNNKEQKA